MAGVSSIIRQLKKERDLVAKQLSGIDAALTAFATVYRMPRRERRRMSLAGRENRCCAESAVGQVQSKADGLDIAVPRRVREVADWQMKRAHSN